MRLLPRPLLRIIARYAHEKIDVNAADEQRGLDPGGTALHYACDKGHLEVASALIRNGADINARRYFGDTVLMAACAARRGTHGAQRPDLDTARLILKAGADVNLGSPLFQAAYCNHVDVVRLLWSFVPRSTRRGRYGKTPLMAAASEGHDEVVRVLWTRAPTSTRARRMAKARCTTHQMRATHRRRNSSSTAAPVVLREK